MAASVAAARKLATACRLLPTLLAWSITVCTLELHALG